MLFPELTTVLRTFRIRKWFYSLAGGIFLSLAIVNTFQYKLFFRPLPLSDDHTFVFDRTFQEMDLVYANGENVNTLFFPTAQVSKGVILYLHGNSKHLQHWGNNAKDFVERGYDFFILDYRGFGKSKGQITEFNMYEDAIYAYNHLLKSYDAEDIVIYGRSIGTGVASWLATKEDARMLVLETPFYSLHDLIRTKFRISKVPVNLKYHFPTHEYIRKVKYPIHVIHGTKDRVTPYSSASKLEPLLKQDDSFTVIKNGGHKNLSEFEEFHKILDQIL